MHIQWKPRRSLLPGIASLALLAGSASPLLAQRELCQPLPALRCPPAPCLTPVPAAPAQPGQPAPSAQVQPVPEPTFQMEQAAATGGATIALATSDTGYIDGAIPLTQFRLRFDAAYDDNRPDRAEFFYPKCGCFRMAGDPNAPGPIKPETSVDYQDIRSYIEVALNHRISGFVELPVRFLNPEQNENTSGLGDMDIGFKAALVACPDRFVTFQLRTYIPTGDADRGLGTDHVSLEPALLLYQRLSDRLALEAELRDWIPIGGTDFAGNVIRYGVGASYDVYRSCHLRVAPVVEFVGWTVLDGKEFSPDNGTQDAAGDTILNAKIGARVSGEHNSLYIGYGRALTGEVWYKDIFRLEYRLSF